MKLSVEDYLKGERQSEIRHEFADGSVYAMAETSINNNQVTANLLTNLVTHLHGTSCRPSLKMAKILCHQKTLSPLYRVLNSESRSFKERGYCVDTW